MKRKIIFVFMILLGIIGSSSLNYLQAQIKKDGRFGIEHQGTASVKKVEELSFQGTIQRSFGNYMRIKPVTCFCVKPPCNCESRTDYPIFWIPKNDVIGKERVRNSKSRVYNFKIKKGSKVVVQNPQNKHGMFSSFVMQKSEVVRENSVKSQLFSGIKKGKLYFLGLSEGSYIEGESQTTVDPEVVFIFGWVKDLYKKGKSLAKGALDLVAGGGGTNNSNNNNNNDNSTDNSNTNSGNCTINIEINGSIINSSQINVPWPHCK